MSTTQTTQSTSTKAQEKAQSKAQSKAPSLFYFIQTPGGNALRAFFIALIQAQGAFSAEGKTFRLWPSVNISGHLAKKNILRKDGAYVLSPAGYDMFKGSIAERGIEELIKTMAQAVKSGESPKNIKLGPMVQFK